MNHSQVITHTLHGLKPVGWYGVSRNKKMVDYFSRLYLPAWAAYVVTYGIGIAEILIGLLFFYLLIYEFTESRPYVVKIRILHRLAFKSSIMVFVAFTICDILIGDRVELWEHGCYLTLLLVSYDLWYRTDRYTHGKPIS